MVQVSKDEYADFLKHYAWQKLQSPDYRLGQAFLNYFPRISKLMIEDGDLGTLAEYRLFNETNDAKAQDQIDRWIAHA